MVMVTTLVVPPLLKRLLDRSDSPAFPDEQAEVIQDLVTEA